MSRWTWTVLAVLLAACSSGGEAAPDPGWAFSAGGGEDERGTGIAAFPDGSGAAVGTFSGSITLGAGQPAETVLTSQGDSDAWVLHHGPDGSLEWARQAGSAGPVGAQGVALSGHGSFVVALRFEQSVTVGVGRADAVQLSSAGEADLCLARFRSDGSLAWARRAGGTGYDDARGVAVFRDGSCVVTGYYQRGAIVFGPGEANETVLPNDGQTESYVARFNANGSLRWAKRIRGDATCTGNDVAAFEDGSCVVALRIEGSITFGAGEAGETTLTSAGATDVAVARYASDGTLAWATRAGGAAGDTPWGVATFPDGSCAVTGNVSETAIFGPGEAHEVALVAVGAWDIFLARYDPAGHLEWATSAGGVMQEVARDVAGFPDGSAVLTGRMRDVVTFGAGEANETVLTSHGEADVFVARYRADGTLAWAESVGGAQADQGECVCACGDGACLVTGRFQETAVFHEGDPGETILVSMGGEDAFVARYRAAGD